MGTPALSSSISRRAAGRPRRGGPQRRPPPPRGRRSSDGPPVMGSQSALRERSGCTSWPPARAAASANGCAEYSSADGTPLLGLASWSRTAPTNSDDPAGAGWLTALTTASIDNGSSVIATSGGIRRSSPPNLPRLRPQRSWDAPRGRCGYRDMVSDCPFGFGPPDPDRPIPMTRARHANPFAAMLGWHGHRRPRCRPAALRPAALDVLRLGPLGAGARHRAPGGRRRWRPVGHPARTSRP